MAVLHIYCELRRVAVKSKRRQMPVIVFVCVNLKM